MMLSRLRRGGPKAVAFVYAGYKWFEDHTDDVERWSDKAITQSRNKRIAKVVVPAAHAAKSAAKWVQDNNSGKSRKSRKR